MSVPAGMPEINAPLDPKVAPLVMALRAAGFPTLASCDGHETVGGAEPGQPWVAIMCGIFDPMLMRERLIDWLRYRSVMANVCQVYSTLEDEKEFFPFVRIEVYSDLAEAQL